MSLSHKLFFSNIKYSRKTKRNFKFQVFPSQWFRSCRYTLFLSFGLTGSRQRKNSCRMFGIFGKAWQALLWLVILSKQHHLCSKGLTQQASLLKPCKSKKELALDQLLRENFWKLEISCLIRVFWYAWGLGPCQICQQCTLCHHMGHAVPMQLLRVGNWIAKVSHIGHACLPGQPVISCSCETSALTGPFLWGKTTKTSAWFLDSALCVLCLSWI